MTSWWGNTASQIRASCLRPGQVLLDISRQKKENGSACITYYIKSGKTKSDFLIAVKPNLMMFYSKEDMSVITEPALVEHLINKMAEKGFTNIALVESQNVYGNWFRNREVENVAKHAGYEGRNYRIVDLTKDAVAHQYKGSLGMYLVGKTWRDA